MDLSDTRTTRQNNDLRHFKRVHWNHGQEYFYYYAWDWHLKRKIWLDVQEKLGKLRFLAEKCAPPWSNTGVRRCPDNNIPRQNDEPTPDTWCHRRCIVERDPICKASQLELLGSTKLSPQTCCFSQNRKTNQPSERSVRYPDFASAVAWSVWRWGSHWRGYRFLLRRLYDYTVCHIDAYLALRHRLA